MSQHKRKQNINMKHKKHPFPNEQHSKKAKRIIGMQ